MCVGIANIPLDNLSLIPYLIGMSNTYPKHIDLAITARMKATLEAVSDVTDITEVQLVRNALEEYLQPIYTKALVDRKAEREFTQYVAEPKPKYGAQ